MILVAVGANLPGPDGKSPLITCRSAVEAVRGIAGLRVIAVSRWFRTAPVPASDQPDYINGIIGLSGDIDPASLLARLQQIEADAGRERGLANAARTLDLDIIDCNGIVRDSPDPVLPHPRAHERRFVLVPLAEIVPSWVHPRLGRTVTRLLAELPPEGVALL